MVTEPAYLNGPQTCVSVCLGRCVVMENLEEKIQKSGIGLTWAVHNGNADCFPAMDYDCPLVEKTQLGFRVPQSPKISL